MVGLVGEGESDGREGRGVGGGGGPVCGVDDGGEDGDLWWVRLRLSHGRSGRRKRLTRGSVLTEAFSGWHYLGHNDWFTLLQSWGIMV